MPVKTWILEWGWCGFGRIGAAEQGNLFPARCWGVVRFSWCRGALIDAVRAAVGKK